MMGPAFDSDSASTKAVIFLNKLRICLYEAESKDSIIPFIRFHHVLMIDIALGVATLGT
jgi:hypothetical protein